MRDDFNLLFYERTAKIIAKADRWQEDLSMKTNELPLPPHYKPEKTGEVWRVEYQKLSALAAEWASAHGLRSAAEDQFKIALIVVDAQNTFCIPGFELYVGGRSGTGAVDDNRRLSQFIYRNLHRITEIVPTLDTHQQIIEVVGDTSCQCTDGFHFLTLATLVF